MPLDRLALQSGVNWILNNLKKTDPNIVGLEVNVFRGAAKKKWRDLEQTGRAWIGEEQLFSAMEVPSALLRDTAPLHIRAEALLSYYQKMDASVSGLTLSMYHHDAQHKLLRQSVATPKAFLPPEPTLLNISLQPQNHTQRVSLRLCCRPYQPPACAPPHAKSPCPTPASVATLSTAGGGRFLLKTRPGPKGSNRIEYESGSSASH